MFGSRPFPAQGSLKARALPFGLRRARKSRRAGMTLIEMLLALSVLGILAALAWPSVLRIHNEQKIVDSAEKVRALVAVARVNAIESGLVYQFRHEIAGTHFLVVPFEREFEAVDARTQGAGAAEGLGRFSKASNELPKSVKFGNSKIAAAGATSSSSTTTGGSQQLASDVLSGLPQADKLSGLSWSGPILFQPDGSATDAEFTVVDERGQQVTLNVRGLTGAVAMGRLQREDRP